MGSTPVVLYEEAIAEARAAREWYEARSATAAQAFFAELDYAIEQIGELPELWPTYIEGTRRYLLHRFPFSVVYRKRRTSIQVIAVAHNRRRAGYWKSPRRQTSVAFSATNGF